ncbi:MAG: 16S rRNA (cytosine(1402)-N(4))-methyltransferase RsmH [Alphaproteobacteria bacterium]
MPHMAVMAQEVLDALAVRDGGIYVDGTFGAGGYSRILLQSAKCTVIAIDRDPLVAPLAQALSEEFPDRLHLMEACFGDMVELLPQAGFAAPDGVTFDLGVSSMQLDQGDRGFSFQKDGPLDMRMGDKGPSAAEAVNNLSAEELAAIFYIYGEERRSRAIAKAIIAARSEAPITRTLQLARIVAGALGARAAAGGRHPATRTFQALRIYVNDELNELIRGLHAAEQILKPLGRLAVVSFHSLEDRLVKQFFAVRSGVRPGTSRHEPLDDSVRPAPSFKLLWNGARKPGAAEISVNPRARSAHLRAVERTAASAWPVGDTAMPAGAPASIANALGGEY